MHLKEIARAPLRRNDSRQMVNVTSLAWSPDGKILAVSVFGGQSLLWRPLESHAPYASFQISGGLPSITAFLDDGATFLAGIPVGPVPRRYAGELGAIYDSRTALPIRTVTLPVSSDGSRPRVLKMDAGRRRAVVLQASMRQFAVLDTTSWQMIARANLQGTANAWTVAISADGDQVFMGGTDVAGNRYDAPPRTPTALVRAYGVAGDTLRQVAEILIGKPTDTITNLALSPDGSTLAAAGDSAQERPHDPDDRATDLDRVFLLDAGSLERRSALRWPGRETTDVDYFPTRAASWPR